LVRPQAFTAVTVDYPPGGVSRPHHHAAPAFIFAYAVSGSIRSQVNGGEVRTYKAGEFFYEPPGSAHGVSENASATEPARLLAITVANDGATITTFDE
jgi:quercetin dioxygenase-like cupin family protein